MRSRAPDQAGDRQDWPARAGTELGNRVAQLLAKNPAERPDRAEEVFEALEEIYEHHFGDNPPSHGQDVTSEDGAARLPAESHDAVKAVVARVPADRSHSAQYGRQ
ncbi:hypothetical protein [Streptomyces milbemycinicus]|uniref:hypothetical protein n=1 Tax=Streptomyces milbemycinicus TaxID=476552 RepID=UPI0033F83477